MAGCTKNACRVMKDPVPLSIRLDLPGGSRFGPGKAELLGQIDQTGSISAAARALNMSYPRALKLVKAMNVQFNAALVETYQGGDRHGGARLTPLGHEIFNIYQEINRQSAQANTAALKAMARLCAKV